MLNLKTTFSFLLTILCAFESSFAQKDTLGCERNIVSPYNGDIEHEIYRPRPRAGVAKGLARNNEMPSQQPILVSSDSKHDDSSRTKQVDILVEMVDALEVMQSTFFKVWLGRWPGASDWTGAVMGTHVAAALNSITSTSSCTSRIEAANCTPWSEADLENFVNSYFSQLIGYYFGENAFQLRLQGNDDMLWVVLGWLESIKLINKHNDQHNRRSSFSNTSKVWHGKQYEPAFAHRSHVFYDAVAQTWETELCGGGLTWNPRLRTYKNTITNTQYIAASASMYLFHPGDNNTSPVLSSRSNTSHSHLLPPSRPYDPSYLTAATEAYTWLRNINLTNSHGLYVDGYHLPPNSTHCTLRNEAVYTYNQGVLLSGLRHLYTATREVEFLRDGHALVRSVVRETHRRGSGLGGEQGRGVLHEFCDGRGRKCGQDALAFKGIFFLHFAEFCQGLGGEVVAGGRDSGEEDSVAAWHARRCKEYMPWVEKNARAAMRTRKDGVFGAWWDAPAYEDGREDADTPDTACSDPNDAGLGRTVETQAGGLAVLRAWWELTRQDA